ncbi:putative pyridoxal-dependent decarboxylase domain protein [Rosellinia necatrix]|uniref:Putative pyridoxal-dependent decarboxylase domain protein n=1 Tax=Rosellinia necatrix TaxID=77044 RepID=A0A1S8A760_ROSNE|nr:putative pyridoxal-dependent decarboxylase domain protein [Rosellinia necatrix]
MSPFPSDGNFTNELARILYDTVAKETEVVRKRNTLAPEFHKFLIQGTETIYLIHLPMFHVANYRQQLIVSVEFDQRSREKYVTMKKSYPSDPMILVTQHKTMLKDVVENNSGFKAQIMTKEAGIILYDVNVVIRKTVVSRPLNSKYRLRDYPTDSMPFYLYGSGSEANIDHVITRAPNTQLSASRCRLEWQEEQDAGVWDKDLVVLLEDVREAPMQPFPANAEIGGRNGAIVSHDHAAAAAKRSVGTKQDGRARNGYANGGDPARENGGDEPGNPQAAAAAAAAAGAETRGGGAKGSGFFFRPGARFQVGVWEDGDRSDASSKHASSELGAFVGYGVLTLGESVYVDSEAMNFDPFKKVEKVSEWRYEFDRIGKELE